MRPRLLSPFLLLVFLIAVLVSFNVGAMAQIAVTTYHNDPARTGANVNETMLTPGNVNSTQFGKLFSRPVDGQIYGQPLYVSNLTVNCTSHNVVFNGGISSTR